MVQCLDTIRIFQTSWDQEFNNWWVSIIHLTLCFQLTDPDVAQLWLLRCWQNNKNDFCFDPLYPQSHPYKLNSNLWKFIVVKWLLLWKYEYLEIKILADDKVLLWQKNWFHYLLTKIIIYKQWNNMSILIRLVCFTFYKM